VRKHIPHPVVVARDGAEALDFLFGTGDYEGRDLSIIPTIVLLDLKLPKVNGLEVLRRIKEDPKTRRIPVIIFSSSTEDEDIANSYRFGANSYVCKPVDYIQYCNSLKLVMAYWLGTSMLPKGNSTHYPPPLKF
jgi:two-component system response regulator